MCSARQTEVTVDLEVQEQSNMKEKIFMKEERRARKPHTCSKCGAQIEVGVTYLYIKGVRGKNDFFLNYICDNCYEK